jgi:hypothetical protein
VSTIPTSIPWSHVPTQIFEAFDMLLLIQKGGRTTYFGPLGDHSAALINYLTAVPGDMSRPVGMCCG